MWRILWQENVRTVIIRNVTNAKQKQLKRAKTVTAVSVTGKTL